MATKTATAERPFEIGDRVEWDGDDGTKRTGEVRAMADAGVTTENAWLPWTTKGLRKVDKTADLATDFTRVKSNEAPEPVGSRLLTLPMDAVTPSPQNPRGQASRGDLQALANDIRAHGLINPITVRELSDGKYEIITGERRYRASALAELPTILAFNRGPISLGEALVERVRENAQREQLTATEEAKAIEWLLSEGKSAAEAAIIMGKSEAWVSLTRNLGRMPGEAQELLTKGRLSRSVAEALLPLAQWPKVLVEFARHAANNGWSSRSTEQEVKAKVDAIRYQEQLKRHPETTVTTTTKRTGAGADRINFDDDEEESESTDIEAGERTAQEALESEPQAPVEAPKPPQLTEEQLAAAKMVQDAKDALNDRYTSVCDVLWEAVCAAQISGSECNLLIAVETAIECWQGTGVFAKQSSENVVEVEFTIDGADEETDE